jgi:phosphatidylserine decarboxylase
VAQGTRLLDTVLEMFMVPHPDGTKYIAIAAITAVAAFILGWSLLGLLLLAGAAATAYVFRDPDRVTPLRDGLVVAPADGRVVAVETVTPPDELGVGPGDRVCVSILAGPLDVHVFRAPIAGRIKRLAYVPGAFGDPATDAAARENERRVMTIETPQAQLVAMVQIAGRRGRKLSALAGEGDSVGVGRRTGVIRFGARLDVYLPPGKGGLVAVGQRTIAGETVVGDLLSDEASRVGRRV